MYKEVIMPDQFSRTRLLLGDAAMERLASSRVAVFGIGGVGGYAVEGLARSGVGALDLIDDDKVCLTNINRQIIAAFDTLGRYKVDVAAERIARIAPNCRVRTYRTFFLPSNKDEFDFSVYDYVVDAIDTVTGKLAIIESAKEAKTPVISSMGAGNKLNAAAFEVADIYETSICPLAKVMRRECKKWGIESLKVVYSKEKPIKPMESELSNDSENAASPPVGGRAATQKRAVPGSVSFVPSVVGMIIAGEVVKDLTAKCMDGRES